MKNSDYINVIPSFTHLWLIIQFVARVTRRVPHVQQELLTPSGPHEFTPVFSGVRVARSLIFCAIITVCRWHCPSFFVLHFLITPLVSPKLFLCYLNRGLFLTRTYFGLHLLIITRIFNNSNLTEHYLLIYNWLKFHIKPQHAWLMYVFVWYVSY